ncbi:NAD-dependent epimerase/dehydratase family protein [Sphingomonas astaxanthinifaciens]|uniref:Nucleoside-diphosphate sugar epimerase n=1 Tax=Sphingomonas astaxanthinifaciens DSM 22298 TaxID=1123267 RepID=A0ABQ5Z5D3_9SPHN|nr:NAD(P)H-binding protein [Sphingomonas astaxanthinifaciens]GLR47222.1 nucleoside-diphosphate sugar epimerase [Sphingomonas astaxanthinifaciens DSM 22298]
MRIAMIGATGLVGRNLWPLLEERHELLVIGRRSSGATREKIGAMETWPGLLQGEKVDVAISTLGSTRKAAGSWAAFEAVDRHAVLAFARAARNAGARHFLLVSSSGANAGSRNAYLRLKGEVEQAVEALGFVRVDVVQPGLLLGERDEKRVGEGIAQTLSPVLNLLLQGPLDRYAGIPAEDVARALAALVEKQAPGIFLHQNRALRALVRR